VLKFLQLCKDGGKVFVQSKLTSVGLGASSMAARDASLTLNFREERNRFHPFQSLTAGVIEVASPRLYEIVQVLLHMCT
jgi:hypothetical protein